MKVAWFANAPALQTLPPACPAPVRCPYCPQGAPKHWKCHTSYERYAGDPDDPSRKIDVPRYFCKITGRTFSLLPDALLPYCGVRTGHVLQWLYAIFVQGMSLNTVARQLNVSRGLLRCLKARCLRAVHRLRLAGHEGMLDARAFLAALAGAGALAVARLFRGWKEQEPKLSIVGIYCR